MQAGILSAEDVGLFEDLGRQYEAVEVEVQQLLAKPIAEWGKAENDALLSLTARQVEAHARRMKLIRVP